MDKYLISDFQRRYNVHEESFVAGVEMAQKLCDVLNGGEAKSFLLGFETSFVRQHRYLQGEAYFALLAFMVGYHRVGHDARNEAAVRYADYIRTALEDRGCLGGVIDVVQLLEQRRIKKQD